jgi:hypothetical protein
MSEQRDNPRRDDRDGGSVPSAPPRSGRRPYRRPELVEYGSVAKLTRGSKSVNADGTTNQQKAMVCL